MKTLAYIRYFIYLAYNWNTGIAWHIIRSEIKGEKKFGINTTGADELKHLEEKGIDTSHATIYMPASYELLEDIFNQLTGLTNREKGSHFLDIGCGKGRALCVAAHHGFMKLTGIDFSKQFCEAAKENLLLTQQKIPSIDFSIINNDAFYYEIPADTGCVFLFNPFDETIISAVVQNIWQSLQKNPHRLFIIYINPLHKEYFFNAGFYEVWHCKKMKYLEAVILEHN
jgi:SAM-dependent methyltransferase